MKEYAQRPGNRTPAHLRPESKANPWLVRAIRQNRYGWTRKRWSELTGLSHNTIENIATYRSWRNVR